MPHDLIKISKFSVIISLISLIIRWNSFINRCPKS